MNQLAAVSQRTYGRRTLLLCLMLCLTAAVQMPAQVVGGTILGTVADPSGAVVPQAQILIKNLATGIIRTVTTDAAGFYTAPNLLPGTYEVTASATGFATDVRTDITLTVGAQQVLNFTLNVGKVNEKVQVTSDVPTVELATSAIGAVVDSTTVRELPLNGRSWSDLATLQPGVQAIQTQSPFNAGTNRGNRGFENEVAINGARPQQNSYRLDGININDFANGGSGSVLGGNLGVDAIEEFSVLTSNYSAEYGRTSGGVVNAVTRSGSNQFHGGGYEFLRNSALDARNFFDPGRVPAFKRNQFGAEAGGPIRKDRTFIFGDYEGIRQSLGISTKDTVPSPAARSGQLCSQPDDPQNPCTPSSITVDPSVAKYLNFWPLPNGGLKQGSNGDIGIFTFAANQVINENFFTIHLSHKFSDKDSLAATYLCDVTPYISPDILNATLVTSKTNRQIVTLEETHVVGPNVVNSVRLGYSRAATDNNHSFAPINPLSTDLTLAAIPGQFASAVTVPGITNFTGGVGGNSHYQYFWNSFQGYDDAFYTRGTHSLKFGAALERIELNQGVLSDPSGGFFFGSLSGFITNQPQRFEAGLANSLHRRGIRQTILGLYEQDDWRWHSNLTLNLGLRWEMATVPAEVHGKLASLVNITDPTEHVGSPFFSNTTLRNFEPRVGFAWDPFRKGKTAVRGGFGIFDVLPLPYQYSLLISQEYPFFLHGTARHMPQGSFYTGAYPLLGASSFGGLYVEQHPHRNYVMQWNMNVEHELTNKLSAMAGYVGSRGVHQDFRADEIDLVIPSQTPQGYLWPAPIGSGTTLNPNFGQIGGSMNGGSSFYDGLLVGLNQKVNHGLQFQASYTWGKSIDTSSGSIAGDTFSNALSSLHWFDLRLRRGLSEFDIRRTLVVSATWQVPRLKSVSGPAAWLTNGWELGGIYKANDGVPFTATFGTDGDPQGLNSSDPWAFPNRLTGPGCASLVNTGNPNNYIKTQCFAIPTAPASFFFPNATVPLCSSDPQLDVRYGPGTAVGTPPQCFNLRGNAGRNILIGPGLSNLDFSVFKNNPIRRISETFNVQFRAEFFNILNRPNFAVPITPDNTDIFDSSGSPTGVAGLLTSTTTTAREIQFAVKVVW
jgi:hypothetical protein